MAVSVTACAHPNIALAKYWGKVAHATLRLAAVPSLSVTLDGMKTRTKVSFDSNLDRDRVEIGGAPAGERAKERVQSLLDRVRREARIQTFAHVQSANDFPTAAGLASSASAFAALALAASRAAGLHLSPDALSAMAGQCSVSAARSIHGGFVALPAGGLGDGESEICAHRVAPADHLPMAIVVAVTAHGEKSVSSTVGMDQTQRSSPFYPAWVEHAKTDYEAIRHALLGRDLTALGRYAECSAMRMHAAALGADPPILYWNPTTVAVLSWVWTQRARGERVYATIDAGPHVKLLTSREHADGIAEAVSKIDGVLETRLTTPGGPAYVEN